MDGPSPPGISDIADLAAVLAGIVGADHVAIDPAEIGWLTQDIWSTGAPAGIVVAPGDTEQLSACLKAAAAAGRPTIPRGGGLSYTGGYAGDVAGALLVDTRRMDRVLAVDGTDMVVTVQAGCTWATLHDTLSPQGLRTPFWGPLSGLASTVGGGVAQNNAFFGAGQYGTTAESVVGLTVVTADGTILHTGAGVRADRPTYRHNGPDLTGLFCGDTGALGVKAEVTLRLIAAPASTGGASFGFATADSMLRAMSAMARAGIGAEVFGFDPELTVVRLRRASLVDDARTLGRLVGAQGSLAKGLATAARVAVAGRHHLRDAGHNLHVVVEGRSQAAVEADLATARRIALAEGGREVDSTVPTVVRAQPFAPPNSILGPDGERWVPVHGIVAHSRAVPCMAELGALYAERRAELERRRVTVGFLTTTLSTNGLLIEPVFYWPEARQQVHERLVEPAVLARLPVHPANPDTTVLVASLRRATVDIFRRHGAAHFQIGRCYPYRQALSPAADALLAAVKRHLDPQSRMNPGALGLP